MNIELIDVDGGKEKTPCSKGKIYIIRNRINDKVYVGKTTQTLHARFIQHISLTTISHGEKLRNAIHKLGSDNFYIELLQDNIPEDMLDDRERYWIAEYNSYYNGYNSTFGGIIGEGRLYISDKMLKDWGVYDVYHELNTTQNGSRKAELTHIWCSKMSKIFPEQADYWDLLETESIKMACDAERIECKLI